MIWKNAHARISVAAHVDKLVATVQARFIPGTHLIRYGEGDWNDSLQPVDPAMRDWMASSWTVALLVPAIAPLRRDLRRSGARARRRRNSTRSPTPCAADFNALSDSRRDRRRLWRCSRRAARRPNCCCIRATAHRALLFAAADDAGAIIGGLFTPEQTRHHLGLIREHLLFPDGARLMDRPSRLSRRPGDDFPARRIRGVLRPRNRPHVCACASALCRGDGRARRISRRCWTRSTSSIRSRSTERLANALAAPAQRLISAAATRPFPTAISASAEWERVKAGAIAVDGGWRIYSSGPGITVSHVDSARIRIAPAVTANGSSSPACRIGRRASNSHWPGRLSSGSRRQ